MTQDKANRIHKDIWSAIKKEFGTFITDCRSPYIEGNNAIFTYVIDGDGKEVHSEVDKIIDEVVTLDGAKVVYTDYYTYEDDGDDYWYGEHEIHVKDSD